MFNDMMASLRKRSISKPSAGDGPGGSSSSPKGRGDHSSSFSAGAGAAAGEAAMGGGGGGCGSQEGDEATLRLQRLVAAMRLQDDRFRSLEGALKGFLASMRAACDHLSVVSECFKLLFKDDALVKVEAENSRRCASSMRNGLLPQLELTILDLVCQPMEACLLANGDIYARLADHEKAAAVYREAVKLAAAEQKKALRRGNAGAFGGIGRGADKKKKKSAQEEEAATAAVAASAARVRLSWSDVRSKTQSLTHDVETLQQRRVQIAAKPFGAYRQALASFYAESGQVLRAAAAAGSAATTSAASAAAAAAAGATAGATAGAAAGTATGAAAGAAAEATAAGAAAA